MTPEESIPSLRPTPDGALAVWVIYERPKDYPHGYMLRCQWAMKDGSVKADDVAWHAATADALRRIVPPGLTRMTRQPSDDPAILETWI